MEQIQKSDGIQSKCVIELYESCEKGAYTKIKKLLEDELFSRKTLDTAMRKCMRNKRRDRNEYHDSLNLLLQYVDINYKNSTEEDSTIIMISCKIADVNLVDLILSFDFSKNQSYAKDVDLIIRDENGRNFLHYLVTKETQEEDACEIFEHFIKNFQHFQVSLEKINEDICTESLHNNFGTRNSHNTHNTNSTTPVNISKELNVEDKFGYTPLAMSLENGWAQLSKKFILAKSKALVIKSSLNNLIHLAVLGKNLNCIKLILTYCTIGELQHKNKDRLTPKELALSLGLNYYAKIMENYEENCFNPSFISIFVDQSTLLVSDILEKFYLEDYTETLFLLDQLKINQSILSTSDNPSIEWNMFLTKYHIKIITNYNKPIEISAAPKTHDITPENILSKFIQGRPSPRKKINCLLEFKDFFENTKITTISIDEDKRVLDIIIYNKGIYYYKQGDFINTVKIFSAYLKIHLPQNDMMYYKWIIYVNISFILIEGLISLKYTKLVSCIIEKLEEFLFTHIRTKKDDIFTNDMIGIRDYLHSKEVLNQFTSTWDESFCLVNLYKAMRNIYEVKIDEAKVNLNEFKKLYKNCCYKDEVRVMFTMHNFYTCLKVKMYYYENTFSKCIKNLNKIHNLILTPQINIRINDQKVDQRFNDNEYIIFYTNSIGIIHLKQKKFMTAEFFFKAGIYHYKKIYFLIESNTCDFSIRLGYIYCLKYNLALCYFFQKQYDKAHVIFREITKNRNMNTNIFLWHRLGLCCLEIELAEIRNNYQKISRNDIVSKVHGYEGNSNKASGIYSDNSSYKYEDLIEANLNFIDDDDIPTPHDAKRIVVQNKCSSSNNSRRRLLEAISYFKNVILYAKSNINCNSHLNEGNQLNEIYSFYFDKKSEYMESNCTDDFEYSAPKIKSLNAVLTSAYLNLIFSLSLTENWTEVIFFCDHYEKSEFYKKEKEIIYKIDNYKIEALINLRQIERAMELIRNNAFLLNVNDSKGSFYNRLNNRVYNDVSYRIALNVNMAKIHFISNNISEADKCISNIIIAHDTDIPSYLHSLIIYSYLVKGQTQIALNFIKYKKATLNLNYTNSKK